MTDPLRSLKYLPWRSLLEVAAIATLIVVALEFILGLGYAQSNLIRQALSILYARPLGLLVNVAVAFGVGVLAVYLLERLYKRVIINNGSLWALVPCLALLLLVKSLLPVQPILVDLDQTQLMGILVGIFWQGRPYWR
ncbi:MAG: peptide chain release factor 1 [Aphanothece sp. CMT-3BRIN-NPC111]|jgi:hypothetical protein|nr:peptide chain release factor 1 [Aphanothece sp. CMT-3BRIN-NPC111]